MTADQYLYRILLREAVDAGPNSPLLGVQAILMPILRQWAGDNLLGVERADWCTKRGDEKLDPTEARFDLSIRRSNLRLAIASKLRNILKRRERCDVAYRCISRSYC